MDRTGAAALLESIIGTGEMIANIAGTGRIERREGYLVQRSVLPVVEANGLFAFGPEEAPAVAAMSDVHDEMRAEERPFGVSTIDGRTPAVERAAEALGLVPESTLSAMRMPRASFRPAANPALRIERVAAAQSATWVEVVAAGFEMPPAAFEAILTPSLLAVLDEPWIGAVIAWSGDEPVSTACFIVRERGVAVANVATPPTHRGKGYGSAATADAVRRGFEAGADFAWLEASPMGLGLYERLGFETAWRQTCRAVAEGG